ncbi:MAG: protein kinase [Deltaproteobacteria bacterium]|nr:protein kinase [Deltaproteobacteria bacterium]
MDDSTGFEGGLGAEAQKCLPGFDLLKRLGQVPNGEIFQARDKSGGGSVLVKAIPTSLQLAGAGATWEQLRAETGQLRHLYHERISNLLEAVDGPDSYVMALALPSGESLRRHLKAHGRPAREEAIGWARQILVLLTEAHGAGILHRYLGQDAIFVDENRQAALCGFSLTSFSPANSVVFSPEQRAGGLVDIRSDLYGVTQVLQECLMVASGSALEAALAPGDPLWAVFQRALAEDPAERYSDAVALSQALSAAQQWEAPVQKSPDQKSPDLKPLVPEPEILESEAPETAMISSSVSAPASASAAERASLEPEGDTATVSGESIETRAFNYPRSAVVPSTEGTGSWVAPPLPETAEQTPAAAVSSSSNFRSRSGLDAPPPPSLSTSSMKALEEPPRTSRGPWLLVIAAALISLLASGWILSRRDKPSAESAASPPALQQPTGARELRAREAALAERAAQSQAASSIRKGRGAGGPDASELVQLGLVDPDMQKPEMQKPGMAKPGMAKPEMSKPEMSKPGMTKPGMSKTGHGEDASAGDRLAVREFLQSGVVSNLYRHADLPPQDRPLLEAVAADIASLDFAPDLHGDEHIDTVFGVNPLLGENNPLLGEELLEQWLVVGVRELGPEHALEHIRQQSESTARGELDRQGWYEHVTKCEVLCGMVVIGMLYEHIQQVAVSPHELLTFDLGSESISSSGLSQLDALRAQMGQGDRMLLIGRASRIGDRSFNRELSRRRVEAAMDVMEAAGISRSFLSGFWLGYEPPQITAELAALYRLPEDLPLDELNQSVLAVVVRSPTTATAAAGG